MARSPPPPPTGMRKHRSSRRGRAPMLHRQRQRHVSPSPPPPARNLRPRRSSLFVVDNVDFFGLSSSSEDSEDVMGRRKVPSRQWDGEASEPSISASGDDDVADGEGSSSRRKLKLVVKLSRPSSDSEADAEVACPDDDVDEEEEEQIIPPKKRRLESCGEKINRSTRCDGVKKEGINGVNSGMRSWRSSLGMSRVVVPLPMRTPLPERSALEAVLDRLQKKDTYGVFAEPVDPEELPDYCDVIEHPMDFGTVRRKLARSVYRSFEQFEDDVFLICSNAMQYNAPDTIYFRQAHSIQEMARKKFQKLRDEGISTENEENNEQEVRPKSYHKELDNERKSEQKVRTNVCHREAVKKTICRNRPDCPSSDISSAATPVSAGEGCNGIGKTKDNGGLSKTKDNGWLSKTKDNGGLSKTKHTDGLSKTRDSGLSKTPDRLSKTQYSGLSKTQDSRLTKTQDSSSKTQDSGAQPPEPAVVDGFVDNSSSLGEIKYEKTDELSARDSPAKTSSKPAVIVIDENRRHTYNLPEDQHLFESDLLFDVFAGEPTQLIDVGLSVEFSYARSLARFAASFGSNAWKIASERIRKTLPPDVKFGRGWVGEYEPPLSTSVLSVVDQSQNQLSYKSNLPSKASPRTPRDIERPRAAENGIRKDTPFSIKSRTTTATVGISDPIETPELKPRIFDVPAEVQSRSSDTMLIQRSQKVIASRSKSQSKASGSKSQSTTCNQITKSYSSVSTLPTEIAPHRAESSRGDTSKMNGQPKNFIQPSAGVTVHPGNEPTWIYHGRPSDGKLSGNSDKIHPSNGMGFITKNQSGTVANFAMDSTGQKSINDRIKLMGSSSMMSSQMDNQNKGNNAPKQLFSAFPSSVRENHSTPATPAQSWISFGASSESKPFIGTPSFLANPGWTSATANLQAYDYSKARIMPQFFRPPTLVVNENSVQNNGLVIFPQLVSADFSRNPQGRPQWQLSPHTQQKPSQDTLRPDLNIGFPSPRSPAQKSSGINLEAQQPDLALQL